MFKTTSISTKSLLLISTFFFFASCGSESSDAERVSQSSQRNEAPSAEKREKEEEKELEPLTDESAPEFLKRYAKENSADEAVIKTPHGDIRIRLYENTPLHRANFVYLARQDYFDDTWFYRVSRDHVIQAGNTDAQETVRKRMKLGDYKVPSATDVKNYHKKGAVAAVRSYFQNPNKDSDPYEFYIVLGKSYSRRQLERLAEKHDMTFTEDQLDFYSNTAGAPHLDGQHTVFGEVIEGMDVVEKINQVRVDEGEWPLINIPIDVEILE